MDSLLEPNIDLRWNPDDLKRIRETLRPDIEDRRSACHTAERRELLVCAGGACISCHSPDAEASFNAALAEAGLEQTVRVVNVGCMGLCGEGPLVLVCPDGVYYQRVDAESARRIVDEHLVGGKVCEDLEINFQTEDGSTLRSREVPFFAHQQKIALRNCGVIDPTSIEEYVASDGYAVLATALHDKDREHLLDEMKKSGLRGRGGAGFPTGYKWEFVTKAPEGERFVACNADEGDPGAFMDRSILEGDPHAVLEGMAIAGFVIGAKRGFVYVRAEYPLAIERLSRAISDARKHGLLGRGVLGFDFDFDVEIRIGAGAFVCGEETALMRSIEGRRGMPSPRPPFPAREGLWRKPTLLNNVESWANVPAILLNGSSWYGGIGTERSKGTKVFALAGSVRNTGLIEVPMGTTMREVVDGIGGGVSSGLPFKAVQSGGPSGGCVPAASADVPIDFESLQDLGAIMGSGGLVVLDDSTCMVELSRFFLEFLVDESCGKCPPCRIGTRIMFNMLDRITRGEGGPEDLETLQQLGEHIQKSSACGLGQTAPNAFLSTYRHFKSEYEAHFKEKRCPALSCKELVSFYIDPEKCKACLICLKQCPAGAIDGAKKTIHIIDQDLCNGCGICEEVCPDRFSAVIKISGEPVPPPLPDDQRIVVKKKRAKPS